MAGEGFAPMRRCDRVNEALGNTNKIFFSLIVSFHFAYFLWEVKSFCDL